MKRMRRNMKMMNGLTSGCVEGILDSMEGNEDARVQMPHIMYSAALAGVSDERLAAHINYVNSMESPQSARRMSVLLGRIAQRLKATDDCDHVTEAIAGSSTASVKVPDPVPTNEPKAAQQMLPKILMVQDLIHGDAFRILTTDGNDRANQSPAPQTFVYVSSSKDSVLIQTEGGIDTCTIRLSTLILPVVRHNNYVGCLTQLGSLDAGDCFQVIGEEGGILYTVGDKGNSYRSAYPCVSCSDPVSMHRCVFVRRMTQRG